MNSLLSLAFLLSLPVLLTGCGGGQTTAKLEVSSAYMSTAPFGGGFIVIGENTTTLKRFSMAVKDANQITLPLENGVWNFAAVGWDGGTGNIPFGGMAYCGGVSSFDLNSTNATVKIDISNANCNSSLFQAQVQFKTDLKVLGCDAFYLYDKLKDEFNPLPPEHAANFCNSTNMIVDYLSKFPKYRIQALSAPTPDALVPAFMSECKNVNDITAGAGLSLPVSKFPFKVMLYKTDNDCIKNQSAQQYMFPTGLAQGAPFFDSLYSPANGNLLLATSPTKRGRSPFMKEIPRINCGAYGSFSDCVSEPTSLPHVNVNFNGYNFNSQPILKNIDIGVKTCAPAIISSSKFFDTEYCEVEDRTVKIQPFRNEFICQRSGGFYPGTYTIKDIHKKGNKIYVLRYDSGTSADYLTIYTDRGRQLNEFSLGPNSALKVAANAMGDRVAVISTSNLYLYNVTGYSISTPTMASIAANDIEMNSSGDYIYLAMGKFVKSVFTNNPYTIVDSIQFPTATTIDDLKFRAGLLYVLENNFGNNIFKFTSLAGELPDVLPAPIFNVSDSVVTIEVDGSKVYAVSTGSPSQIGYSILEEGMAATPNNIISGNTPVAAVMIKNKLVIADSMMFRSFDPLINPTSNLSVSGSCTETLNLTFGGIGKAVDFSSKEFQTVDPLFKSGFEFLGKRFFNDTDRPFYYFESLSHNDDKTAGGELRRVQEMLGPQALGAFFSNFPDCASVVNAAPFSKTATFFDESNGKSIQFNLTVTKSSAMMESFVCAENVGTCPSDPMLNKYDLEIYFNQSTDGKEDMKFKLKCGQQLGSFESFEYKSSERIRRERYLYYTSVDTKSRYEKYQIEDEIGKEKRSDVLKVYRDVDTIHARQVRVSVDSSQNKYASVMEFVRNPNNIFESRIEFKSPVSFFYDNNSSIIFPYSTLTFNQARDNYSMLDSGDSATARACMTSTQTSLNATNISGCTFPTLMYDSMSLNGMPLRPNGYDIENPTHVLSTGVFEIP